MSEILKITCTKAYFGYAACRLLHGKKNLVLRIVLMTSLWFCHLANGQEFPAFQQLRYDEVYAGLEKDTVRDLYHKVKYTKIGSDAYISFGGDFRTQYLIIDNENWNPAMKDNDGFTLNRWLFHSDLHLSKNLRVFAEL